MTSLVSILVLLALVAAVVYPLERSHARWRHDPGRSRLGADLSRDRDGERLRSDLAARRPTSARR